MHLGGLDGPGEQRPCDTMIVGSERAVSTLHDSSWLFVGRGEQWKHFIGRLRADGDFLDFSCSTIVCRSRRQALGFIRSSGLHGLFLDWGAPRSATQSAQICDAALKISPQVGLIAVTAPHAADDRINALETGVDDCVSYDVDCRELIARMKSVQRRMALRFPETEYPVELQERLRALTERCQLSPREANTLFLMAQGVHLKEVGTILGCEYSTVRTYARRVCRKLDCSGAREAIVKFFSPIG